MCYFDIFKYFLSAVSKSIRTKLNVSNNRLKNQLDTSRIVPSATFIPGAFYKNSTTANNVPQEHLLYICTAHTLC